MNNFLKYMICVTVLSAIGFFGYLITYYLMLIISDRHVDFYPEAAERIRLDMWFIGFVLIVPLIQVMNGIFDD